MKDRAHGEAIAELFRDNPAFAAEYLGRVIETGEQTDVLIAVRPMNATAVVYAAVPAPPFVVSLSNHELQPKPIK